MKGCRTGQMSATSAAPLVSTNQHILYVNLTAAKLHGVYAICKAAKHFKEAEQCHVPVDFSMSTP